MKPFNPPIYITRPMLPDQKEFSNLIDEIWQSQWLTNNGQKHQTLENSLREILKVPYLSLFTNGTIALLVAIKSLKLTGEVITTPFTFPATSHALEWNNISPVFCDINEETLTLDHERIEDLITPKTSGILGVHVYGRPCNVDGIQEISDLHGLQIIYDAAHAFNSEIEGIGIGTFGDITMFSFHATKLFHTVEGGALTTKDEQLKNRIDYLKNFGIKNEEEIIMSGINGKMNELQSAIGILNLKSLDDERDKRRKILQRYLTYLQEIPGIDPFLIPDNVRHSYQYFMIRVNRDYGLTRDELYTKLRTYNVISRKYFYPLCSNLNVYKHLESADPKNLPVANKIVTEVLCLPFYGNLALEDVDKICEIIKELRQ